MGFDDNNLYFLSCLKEDDFKYIAEDAVNVLAAHFPPATTCFDISSVVKNNSGITTLVDNKFEKEFYSHLLTKGFAILKVGLAKKSGDGFFKENEQLRSYKLDYVMGSTNRKNAFWGQILVGEKHSFHFCFSLKNGKWRIEEDTWRVFGFERKGVKNGRR